MLHASYMVPRVESQSSPCLCREYFYSVLAQTGLFSYVPSSPFCFRSPTLHSGIFSITLAPRILLPLPHAHRPCARCSAPGYDPIKFSSFRSPFFFCHHRRQDCNRLRLPLPSSPSALLAHSILVLHTLPGTWRWLSYPMGIIH